MSENIIYTATKMNEVRFLFKDLHDHLLKKLAKTFRKHNSNVFDVCMTTQLSEYLNNNLEKFKNSSYNTIEDFLESFLIYENDTLHLEKNKTKRFSREILEVMEKSFIKNDYPSDNEKIRIARRCHITVKQVANWFTNKRNRSKDFKNKKRYY